MWIFNYDFESNYDFGSKCDFESKYDLFKSDMISNAI